MGDCTNGVFYAPDSPKKTYSDMYAFLKENTSSIHFTAEKQDVVKIMDYFDGLCMRLDVLSDGRCEVQILW